jgi:hypothetical protein
VQWNIRVPTGSQTHTSTAKPISPADSALQCAAARINLLRSSGKRLSPEAQLHLQQEIENNLAQAEHYLADSRGGVAGETGPAGQSLPNWLQQLRNQSPPPTRGAKNSLPAAPFSEVLNEGELHCWQTTGNDPLILELTPQRSWTWARWLATLLLAALLLVSWKLAGANH